MQYRIFIVEDNEMIIAQMRQYICEYISMYQLPADLQVVGERFESILDRIDTDPPLSNVYFLDIVLGGASNGLKLAQKIRSKDIFGYIIFVTSHMEFAFPAIQYKVRALDYILKGDDELRQRIFQCLDTVRSELSRNPNADEPTILIRTSGTNFIIPMKDIVYLETNTAKRSIILHTHDKSIEFRGTLDELQHSLNDNFYRCHRSFLINLQHVQTISNKRNDLHVMMSHGFKCLISPRYLKGLLKYERHHI